MSLTLEARFKKYRDKWSGYIEARRSQAVSTGVIKGLILPGKRKSIEPIAARLQPQNARSAHPSMHHLVAQALWSDEAMCSAVTDTGILLALLRDNTSSRSATWIAGVGKWVHWRAEVSR